MDVAGYDCTTGKGRWAIHILSARRKNSRGRTGPQQVQAYTMKVFSTLAVVAMSSILTVSAKHGDIHPGGLEHRHLHHKGRALSVAESSLPLYVEERELGKRTGQCAFPEDAGLVPVPGSSNGGWAMSPDECCEPGGYCPYACPPGQVSMQWDPKATSYSYPQSMVSVHTTSR